MVRLWNGPSLQGHKRRNGTRFENKLYDGKSIAKQTQNIKSRIEDGVYVGNKTSSTHVDKSLKFFNNGWLNTEASF